MPFKASVVFYSNERYNKMKFKEKDMDIWYLKYYQRRC